MNKCFLNVDRLSFSYTPQKPLIKDLSFCDEVGSIHAIVGSSGSGKSTLIRLIAGFEKPQKGQISIASQLCHSDSVHVSTELRNIGILFQDHTVFPHLSVQDNIAFPIPKWPKESREKRVKELLEVMNIQDLAKKMPEQISGGQKQRVGLALALSNNPKLLLLDEPFSNLDQGLKFPLIQELRQVIKSLSLNTVFITHTLLEYSDQRRLLLT